jgi:hypothetical protein
MFRKVKVPVRHPARIFLRISADVLFARFLAWYKTCLHSHVQTVLPHILSSAVKGLSKSVTRWTLSFLLIYLSIPAFAKMQIVGSQQWLQSQTVFARRCSRTWPQISGSSYSSETPRNWNTAGLYMLTRYEYATAFHGPPIVHSAESRSTSHVDSLARFCI